MIYASFLENQSKKPVTFREKNLIFWIKKKFSRFNFVSIDNISDDAEYIILFDPEKFLNIKEADFTAILNQLRSKKGSPVKTIKHTPLYFINDIEIVRTQKLLSLINKNQVEVIDDDSTFTVLNISEDLPEIENEIKRIQLNLFSEQNIEIEDFNHFNIAGDIEIGENVKIGSGVVISGISKIGNNVRIFPNNFIENSEIGDDCVLLPGCIIRDSVLKGNNQLGPYAHLRNNAIVEVDAKIGNFVEMKKSYFGKGSKAMHLTYIGDSEIGKNVNIGAGTITCNYDGINKNKTTIEDGVFIGSGTELIAPVKIGKNSYVAAGSTITSDIPEDSLGVARERQRTIKDWVKRKKKK